MNKQGCITLAGFVLAGFFITGGIGKDHFWFSQIDGIGVGEIGNDPILAFHYDLPGVAPLPDVDLFDEEGGW